MLKKVLYVVSYVIICIPLFLSAKVESRNDHNIVFNDAEAIYVRSHPHLVVAMEKERASYYLMLLNEVSSILSITIDHIFIEDSNDIEADADFFINTLIPKTYPTNPLKENIRTIGFSLVATKRAPPLALSVLNKAMVFVEEFKYPAVSQNIWYEHRFLLIVVGIGILLISIHLIVFSKIQQNHYNDLVKVNSELAAAVEKEHESYEQLKEAEKTAREKNSIKSDFLGRMSHDMRTPLNGIIGLAKFGIEEANDDGIQHYFKRIKSSSEFLLRLLNDLLDLTQIENAELEIQNEPVNNTEMIQEILELIKPRAKEKSITVLLDRKEPIVSEYEYLDKIKTSQIFFNILGNAVKYTPNDGIITWHIRDEKITDEKVIHYHEISDTGFGMSEAYLKKIFEPFTREENMLSFIEGGTGLGMTITKRLIDTLGGSIRVKSKKGCGTTFFVSLSSKILTKKKYYESIDKKNDHRHFNFEGRSVLLCEDNELNSMIARKLLEQKSIKVDCAENGLEGVKKMRAATEFSKESVYDCILMDIRMPIMNGLDAAKEIRSFNPSIPIIALSANAYIEDIEKSYAAGMDEHLMKPIDSDALFKVLAQVMHTS